MPTTPTWDRLIDSNSATIAADAFGSSADPAVLLLAGTSCARDWWRPEFVAELVQRERFVIRFDLRDTGGSTGAPVGEPDYGIPDLLDDALAVLDAADVRSAHWVGFSLGGWIAQLAAIQHPARVDRLTLMSTRPTAYGDADADLPEVADGLMARFADPAPAPDWGDHAAIVDYLVEAERDFAGDEFDEANVRDIWTATVARSPRIEASLVNHGPGAQPRWRERLPEIGVPTTVVHGTSDPLFPFGNAEALAREIPGARLVPLPGVGHELPTRVWPTVIDAITS